MAQDGLDAPPRRPPETLPTAKRPQDGPIRPQDIVNIIIRGGARQTIMRVPFGAGATRAAGAGCGVSTVPPGTLRRGRMPSDVW